MHTVRQLISLFSPTHYDIHIDISGRVQREFTSDITLTGALHATAKQIVLHAKGLEVQSASIDTHTATCKQGEDDELILSVPTELLAGEHTVKIKTTGKITDSMQGLYPCYFTHNGQEKELLMTQLESHYAREIFPCIDEPAAKATFSTTLTTETGITVLGNTPVKTQAEDNGKLVTIFEPTPRMSTYLFAFVTGELAYKETVNQHGVKIRAYATPDNVDQTAFALDFAAKTLDFYDDYFGLPYPLPKCDIVAVPDFSAGAMENWGLVTFRENAMLLDEPNSSADSKEWTASVVSHELAHQWFGNLVTMQWWDDLWLNESFAKWMEHLTLDHFHPEWRVWEQYNGHEQQYALTRDGLAGVQAVQQPVNHPDELHSLFDPAIVYAKGSCLIRMLQEYLGAEVFRDGMRLYMKRHQYKNAVASDLWAALAEVSGKDVASFMQPWIHQPGHPVLTVGTSGSTVNLHQRRFYANPKEAKEHDSTVWPLPLLSDQLQEPSLHQTSTSLQSTGSPVLLNKNHTAFYHVQYDESTLTAHAQQVVKGQLSVTDRQGLLVDGLALARAGLSNLASALALINSYKKESSYPVWQSISAIIGAVKTIIREDENIKPHLQQYVVELAQSEFKRLGWDRKKGEPYFDELLRPSMIGYMVYAEIPEVIEHALKLYDTAVKPEDIPADIRTLVYTVAIRERGQAAYERMLEWYKTTKSAEERVNLCAGITDMKDPQIAKQALDLLTTKTVKPQDVFYWFVYMMRNKHSRQLTWQWMQDNWPWIEKQFKGGHDYADFPKYSASGFGTQKELDQYKAFFEPKKAEQELARTIEQGIEDIEIRALWRERDLAGVADYLKSVAK